VKILLTNDDGIESPGLQALLDVLGNDHEVWIVAPDRERSGTSHSITLHEAVRFRPLGERRFACGGTPADCVLFSVLGAVPVRPDLVVSGINLGPNLGTDIIYSATVAAARQAALMGLASVAVSVTGVRTPFYFDAAALFVARNAETVAKMWKGDHFLNINVPNQPGADLPVTITHPSRRTYRDKLSSFVAPNKDTYHFLQSVPAEAEADPGSDWEAVTAGSISVSPIYLHPVNHVDYLAYEEVEFRLQ